MECRAGSKSEYDGDTNHPARNANKRLLILEELIKKSKFKKNKIRQKKLLSFLEKSDSYTAYAYEKN